VVALALLGGPVILAAPASAYSYFTRYRTDPLPGVEVRGIRDAGAPLSIDVGRVARGAAVRLEVVRAGEAVAGDPGRLETTSAACRRVGAILCVNGDFGECISCGAPMGAVVHDGVLERTPLPTHPQLRVAAGSLAAGPLGLGATMHATATYVNPDGTERVAQAALPLDSVNRARGADQVVLYTPRWAGSTNTGAGGDEALLGGGEATLGADIAVHPRELRMGAGSTPVPPDGMLLSASGTGTARLRSFWAVAADQAAAHRSVVLRPRADRPVEESVGGHPVILAAGQTLIASSTDPFATSRHPRTMIGWNPAGDLWLVTVDGRQPGHSIGMSLGEGADLLRQLGATDGFNVDGGGSTTFVSLPPDGGRSPVVLNRPSDGSERRLATFLAVVPNDQTAVRCGGVGAPRLATASTSAARSADSNGYRMVAADGGIFTYGDAGFHGALNTSCLATTVVATAPSPSGRGYWMASADGGVFAFGDAGFFGSAGGRLLNRPIVGMAATPTGGGYWLVASDGGIFAFGDARFRGSTGGLPLNRPVVGMAATPTGGGYWLVASDGGIFAFGDARFRGSTGSFTLNRPVVGMDATPAGDGYWLVASDGGIFAFGTARFSGSTGSFPLNAPIVGMTSRASGVGYWLVASDGGIFAFGGAPFLGSTGGIPLNRPIVAMARTR
jgi:hypothetical protein